MSVSKKRWLRSPPGVVSAPIMMVDVALKKPEALSGHARRGVVAESRSDIRFRAG